VQVEVINPKCYVATLKNSKRAWAGGHRTGWCSALLHSTAGVVGAVPKRKSKKKNVKKDLQSKKIKNKKQPFLQCPPGAFFSDPSVHF